MPRTPALWNGCSLIKTIDAARKKQEALAEEERKKAQAEEQEAKDL